MATKTAQEAKVPAVAEAIVDLLNSRAYAIHADKLDDPELARALLAPFGQHDEVPLQRLDLVRGLRANLMALVAGSDPADAWRAFTERTATATFRQDFTVPGEVRTVQAAGDPVVGGITLAVTELVDTGAWPRVRTCANDGCRKVFYDTTRSRTRRWHSYEICGNRTNVAAYRARTTKQDQSS